MFNRYLGIFLAITAVTVMLFPVSAFAQASRVGSIEGRVDDSEGAVLPGATITLSSPNLIGGDKISVTGADGSYRFPALPPGTYAVAVNMGGFIPQSQADINVSVSQKLQVIFTMQLGTTDEVTVLGQPPLVDVKNSSVANAVVTADFAQALPSGRSAAGLINYIPGVVGNTDRSRRLRLGIESTPGTGHPTIARIGLISNLLEGAIIRARALHWTRPIGQP